MKIIKSWGLKFKFNNKKGKGIKKREDQIINDHILYKFKNIWKIDKQKHENKIKVKKGGMTWRKNKKNKDKNPKLKWLQTPRES